MAQIGKPPCDEAVIRLGGPASACAARSKRWVLVAAIVGSSMAFVDGTVVNVALPAIQRDFNATAFEAQWVVESYALLLAALLLVGGSLGDRFGRRRVFMLGTVVFAVASVACALATSVHALIGARAVQGVGAALLVPGSLALISAAFPENERGRAIGTWSGFSGITAALGPVLGGALIDHYSWTWAFLINVPLAIVVLGIAAAHVPESRGAAGASGGALDITGALLATVALGGIVFAFIEAPARGWTSAVVLGALAAGVAAGIAFVVAESRSRAPMLPLGLFRSANFAGANLLTLLLYAALGGALYFLPLNLIQVQGWSASAAGAALLPFIAIMFALSRWSGQLVDRVGPKTPLVAGPLIAALGFALFALPGIDARYASGFMPAVVVLGLGMAITVAPLTTTVMNAVAPDSAGVASGVNNAVSRAAAVLAIAVFGIVMAWAFDASLRAQLGALNAAPEVVAFLEEQRGKLVDAALPPGLDAARSSELQQALEQAFVAGFRWIMLLSAGLAGFSAFVAWRWIEGRAPAR